MDATTFITVIIAATGGVIASSIVYALVERFRDASRPGRHGIF